MFLQMLLFFQTISSQYHQLGSTQNLPSVSLRRLSRAGSINSPFFFPGFAFFFFFTLQYCIGFAIHWHESAMGIHVFPILNPTLGSSHPSGSSQRISPEHPVSCVEPGLAIHFTYDNLHVSVTFSHIIPPLLSPTESKRLFNTSVCLLLSRIQDYHYHLSKFHIYALVYCIGVFLSGLLHSV